LISCKEQLESLKKSNESLSADNRSEKAHTLPEGVRRIENFLNKDTSSLANNQPVRTEIKLLRKNPHFDIRKDLKALCPDGILCVNKRTVYFPKGGISSLMVVLPTHRYCSEDTGASGRWERVPEPISTGCQRELFYESKVGWEYLGKYDCAFREEIELTHFKDKYSSWDTAFTEEFIRKYTISLSPSGVNSNRPIDIGVQCFALSCVDYDMDLSDALLKLSKDAEPISRSKNAPLPETVPLQPTFGPLSATLRARRPRESDPESSTSKRKKVRIDLTTP